MPNRNVKLSVCLFCWAWLAATSHAQVEEAWRKRLNGDGNGVDEAKAIVVDGAGNVYVAGEVIALGGVKLAVITKYNANGDVVWASSDSIKGTPAKLARDASGNLYMAGAVGNTGARDFFLTKYNSADARQWFVLHNVADDFVADLAVDAAGNVYATGTSSNDYLTVKYDANGQFQWQKFYNGPANGTDEAAAITLNNSGNVYVTGKSAQSQFWADYLTVKYDAQGVEQWARRFDGSIQREDKAVDLEVDNAGNVYVTGYAYNPHGSMTTIKYSSDGATLWSKTTSNSFNVQGTTAIELDAAGNVYVVGFTQGASELWRYYLVKYDNAGALQWETTFVRGDANPTDMIADASGNIYITGYSGLPTTFPVDFSKITYDYTTVKFNSAGVREWFVTLTEDASSRDFARAMALDASGNVYVTGRSIDDIMTVKYRPIATSVPADLIADRVYLRTAENAGNEATAPLAGEQYFVHVDWRNTGTESASNFRLEMQLNGSEVCALNISNAPGNSSLTTACSSPVIWPEGSNVITAALDGFAQVNEEIENNNSASRVYGFATFSDFELTLQVRTTDDFNQNGGADICLVYGYQDEFHYYYVMLNRNTGDSRVYKVRGRERLEIGSFGNFIIPDNAYHEVRLVRSGTSLQTFFDGASLGFANDSEYGAGGLGLGSYNDAPLFDEICIRPSSGAACMAFEEFENGLAENWRTLNPSRWHVTADGGDNAFGVNTSTYSNLDPLRLGEYSLFAPRVLCLKNGDVNADNVLTPGDALCAFQIYLNNGALPSSCDASNNVCELTAADPNCDASTTPGDALAIFSRYLQGLPPAECFAKTALSKIQAQPRLSLQTRTALESEAEFFYATLSVAQATGLSSFGLSLDYPLDKLQFLGVKCASLTSEWIALEGKEILPGQIMLGGFHNQEITAANGEVFEVIFTAKEKAAAPSELRLSDLTDDFKQAHVQGGNLASAVPSAFNLYQSSPNPYHAAQGEMSLRFDLPGEQAVAVELSIYNLAGQLVRQLLKGERAPGAYELHWNGRDEQNQLVPSGTYLYRLKAGKQVMSKRMTVVR